MPELTLARALAEFSERLLCSSPYRHSYTTASWSRNPRVPETLQQNVVTQYLHRKLPACSFHKLQDVARTVFVPRRQINEESALDMKTLCKEHRNLRSSNGREPGWTKQGSARQDERLSSTPFSVLDRRNDRNRHKQSTTREKKKKKTLLLLPDQLCSDSTLTDMNAGSIEA